ncbi:hypothetical protein D3C75_1129510 [compost metagenome]
MYSRNDSFIPISGSERQQQHHKANLIQPQLAHNIQLMGANGLIAAPDKLSGMLRIGSANHQPQDTPFAT